VEEHCSNPQCFKEKNYKATHPAQYEKNKIDKDNSGKTNHKKIKKNHVGNTIAIYSVLKKKNYKAKFSISSILKK
jgi:hypothetical protein